MPRVQLLPATEFPLDPAARGAGAWADESGGPGGGGAGVQRGAGGCAAGDEHHRGRVGYPAGEHDPGDGCGAVRAGAAAPGPGARGAGSAAGCCVPDHGAGAAADACNAGAAADAGAVGEPARGGGDRRGGHGPAGGRGSYSGRRRPGMCRRWGRICIITCCCGRCRGERMGDCRRCIRTCAGASRRRWCRRRTCGWRCIGGWGGREHGKEWQRGRSGCWKHLSLLSFLEADSELDWQPGADASAKRVEIWRKLQTVRPEGI